MIFFKKFREELRSQKYIMQAKEDIRIYGEKMKKDTAFLETQKEATFYHLTPIDLGQSVILEPRQCDNMEMFLIEAGMNLQARNFKCISFSTSVLSCLVRLPFDKLLDYNEFYIYRTKEPIKAWFDVVDRTETDFYFNNEYRVFKETDCIRLGKIIIKEHPISVVEKVMGKKENRWGDLLKPYIEIVKDNENIIFTV